MRHVVVGDLPGITCVSTQNGGSGVFCVWWLRAHRYDFSIPIVPHPSRENSQRPKMSNHQMASNSHLPYHALALSYQAWALRVSGDWGCNCFATRRGEKGKRRKLRPQPHVTTRRRRVKQGSGDDEFRPSGLYIYIYIYSLQGVAQHAPSMFTRLIVKDTGPTTCGNVETFWYWCTHSNGSLLFPDRKAAAQVAITVYTQQLLALLDVLLPLDVSWYIRHSWQPNEAKVKNIEKKSTDAIVTRPDRARKYSF